MSHPRVAAHILVGALTPRSNADDICPKDPIKREHSWSYGLRERRCRRCGRVER